MRALRFHGPGDMRVEKVADPELVPGSVEIRIAWCGICGSDLHEYRHGPSVVRPRGRPHPLTGEHLPVTLGHEMAGEVVRVADDVTSVDVGQRVVVNPLLFCGTCTPCRAGRINLCRHSGAIGLSGGGGFAERIVVPAHLVHRLPIGVTLEEGALVEPLAVAWHAVRRAHVRPGQTALVIGAGPIGLAVLLVLQSFGAGWIAMSVRRHGMRARWRRFSEPIS